MEGFLSSWEGHVPLYAQENCGTIGKEQTPYWKDSVGIAKKDWQSEESNF